MAVLDLHCCMGFSLVSVSRGHSVVVVGAGFLIAVASLVVEHGLCGVQVSVVVAPGLEHRLNSCGKQA